MGPPLQPSSNCCFPDQKKSLFPQVSGPPGTNPQKRRTPHPVVPRKPWPQVRRVTVRLPHSHLSPSPHILLYLLHFSPDFLTHLPPAPSSSSQPSLLTLPPSQMGSFASPTWAQSNVTKLVSKSCFRLCQFSQNTRILYQESESFSCFGLLTLGGGGVKGP